MLREPSRQYNISVCPCEFAPRRENRMCLAVAITISKIQTVPIMKTSRAEAVDAKVLFSDGSQKQLSRFWRKQPLVLVFLRHFG